MSDKHTPGMLQLDEGYRRIAKADDGRDIFLVHDHGKAEANARRLVACWNAAEGLSTESLESAGNAFNGWKLASYAMNDAKAQRDELLTVLKALTDRGRIPPTGLAFSKARAAIAKAEAK